MAKLDECLGEVRVDGVGIVSGNAREGIEIGILITATKYQSGHVILAAALRKVVVQVVIPTICAVSAFALVFGAPFAYCRWIAPHRKLILGFAMLLFVYVIAPVVGLASLLGYWPESEQRCLDRRMAEQKEETAAFLLKYGLDPKFGHGPDYRAMKIAHQDCDRD